jgi:hypothetical protein
MQDEMEDITRIAREHKIKITALCKYLQCSRASYYNWLAGTPVINVYRTKIMALHRLLTEARDPKEAFEVARHT